MPEKFQNKYRIPSSRAQWWNYGNNGAYFVTICTKNKEHYFGEIANGEMHVSAIGKLANEYWHMIPSKFSYALLDEFVVMPNHVHGIITIDKKPQEPILNTDMLHTIPSVPPPKKTGGFAGHKNPMLNDNLSRIMNWYKGRVKYECGISNLVFNWQDRFHDTIIRNDAIYQTIKNYIITNPKNWDTDKFR